MTEKHDASDRGDQIVYVRAVDAADIPQNLQDHLSAAGRVYAIHDGMGRPLALAQDRRIAFAVARRNDLTPVSVH